MVKSLLDTLNSIPVTRKISVGFLIIAIALLYQLMVKQSVLIEDREKPFRTLAEKIDLIKENMVEIRIVNTRLFELIQAIQREQASFERRLIAIENRLNGK